MTAARRWCLVALGLLALVVAPVAVGAWPAEETDRTATELAAEALRASDVAYSGYVESVGGLALPTTDEFGEVADLLGGTNRLRVWWRGDGDWRVDRLGTAGETDLFHEGGETTTWDYEGLRATSTADPLVFLPRTVDLLPPELAQRVLSGAGSGELSRIPAERVAGHDAPGLRLTPSPPQASIDHIDIWVEADTALPLRVEVWGAGDSSPALATTFHDLTLETPPVEVTAFETPPGADASTGGLGGDSLVGHIPAVYRGSALAGLPGVAANPFAPVGRYGRGVTQLLVLALDDEVADPLRDQLGSTAGAVVDRAGTSLASGPLHLLLSPCRGDEPSWLLVGTVDEQSLRAAADRVYGGDRQAGWRISAGPGAGS